MKKLKRIFSLILAMLMCVTTLASISNMALAASTMNVYIIDLPRGADPNKTGWGHPAQQYMGGWASGAKSTFAAKSMGASEGSTVYCIEPGAPLKVGDSFSEHGEDFWDNYPSTLNPTLAPFVMRAYIGRILQYGWEGNNNLNWNTNNPTHRDEIGNQIATQLLVWEVIVGERDNAFGKINANSVGKNNITEMIAGNHPLHSEIFNHYSRIENLVKQHTMLPSFFSRSTGSAQTTELKWSGTVYTVTLTDTNDVLSNYLFSSDTTGLTFLVSGNKLTIASEKPIKGSVTITAEKKNGQRKGLIVWTDGNVSGGNQDMVTYGATVTDPVAGFINIETKAGNMKLLKTSEDGNVANIQFTITGEGISLTKTTTSEGEIDITDLTAGEYTVTEQAMDRYEPQKSQKVTIISGQTTTVTFNNTLRRGELRIMKSSEDGLVEGMIFRLFGTSLSGLSVDEFATTDASGTATFKNVLISGSTPYILEEVDTPNRYVVPVNQNVAISWNKVTNQSVHNTLKKFQVVVTKTDVETTSSQGNASLSGAVYGIYKGEKLVDTYTTDIKGQFTTAYYICGEDWTIREIKPSEGYLLDTTIHRVGASATLYTVARNTTQNAVQEQVVKGNVALIKHSDDGSTQIETPEMGAEFAIYLKSSGSYDNAKESERDHLVCDENGFAQSKDMPYGIYTIHQTKGWDGRELMPAFDVYIAQDGKTYHYLINNANFASYIKIVKKDLETGNIIPYAGSGFQIYRPDSSLVTMTFTYPTPTTIDTFYTNEDGYLITPEKLPFGSGYSLVEVQAPYGYVLDSTPIYFDVIEDNSTSESEITVIAVEKFNIAQKGMITIHKTGELFESVSMTDDLYSPQYVIQGLEGAIYEITALEDIYTLDGTLRAIQGDVVDTIATDSDGFASSKELYLGRYAIKEITAPQGMVLNGNVHEVELRYAGQEVAVTDVETSFYNERQKVSILLTKEMENDDLFSIGTNNEITNVSFGLFASDNLMAKDGTFIPMDGLIERIAVPPNGIVSFMTDLPFGRYYVKELSTNSAYIISDEKYPIVFDYQGQETAIVHLPINHDQAITNTLIRGMVKGLKVDETKKPLEGAVIGLFKPDTTEFSKTTAILISTSSKEGAFSFDSIPYGDYIIAEINAPTGYVLTSQTFPISIGENGALIEIQLENTLIKGNVQVTKVDMDFPNNRLTDTVFEVYQDTNNNEILDGKDQLIGELTEIKVGVYRMEELAYGTYFLKEKTAPEGYCLDENSYIFTIQENNQTVIVENAVGKGFTNTAQKGSLVILKTSSDKKVDGFSFRVEGNGYDQIHITDAQGKISIDGLRIGEYTVSEVANEVSSRYVLPASQTITISSETEASVSFHNVEKDTPKTGDDRKPWLWVSLTGVATLGLIMVGWFGIKKNKRRKEKS